MAGARPRPAIDLPLAAAEGAVLVTLAAPAWATDVTVDVVVASQFDAGVFIAIVTVHGPNPIIDAQLVVNGTAIVPDKVDERTFDGSRNVTLFNAMER